MKVFDAKDRIFWGTCFRNSFPIFTLVLTMAKPFNPYDLEDTEAEVLLVATGWDHLQLKPPEVSKQKDIFESTKIAPKDSLESFDASIL